MHIEVTTIRVASDSRPTAVAGSIAHAVRERGGTTIQAIGAAAVNQAVKAVAIARTYLEEDGLDVTCFPSLVTVMVEGEEKTAVRMEVETI